MNDTSYVWIGNDLFTINKTKYRCNLAPEKIGSSAMIDELEYKIGKSPQSILVILLKGQDKFYLVNHAAKEAYPYNER